MAWELAEPTNCPTECAAAEGGGTPGAVTCNNAPFSEGVCDDDKKPPAKTCAATPTCTTTTPKVCEIGEGYRLNEVSNTCDAVPVLLSLTGQWVHVGSNFKEKQTVSVTVTSMVGIAWKGTTPEPSTPMILAGAA